MSETITRYYDTLMLRLSPQDYQLFNKTTPSACFKRVVFSVLWVRIWSDGLMNIAVINPLFLKYSWHSE